MNQHADSLKTKLTVYCRRAWIFHAVLAFESHRYLIFESRWHKKIKK
jgi:hypothetical protein